MATHLAPFLPAIPALKSEASDFKFTGPVSEAPYGSASILTISWMYIRMMGPDGLTKATKVAILHANYIAKRLHSYFPVLFKGKQGLVAHECILDLRHFKSVTVEDVAKHLGVAKDSVYRWIDTRSLPAHKIGRLWKFKLTEVDEWVRAGGVDAHIQAHKAGA